MARRSKDQLNARLQEAQLKAVDAHREARRKAAQVEGPPDGMPGRCYVCRAPWWQRPLNWRVKHPGWDHACYLCDRCYDAAERLKAVSLTVAAERLVDERQMEFAGMPRPDPTDAH